MTRVAIGACAAGGVGLFAAGWIAHRPPPARVELREVERRVEVAARAAQTERDEAPVRVVERWHTVTPATPSCPAQVVDRERVVERGPVHTETAAVEARASTAERQADLRVVDAPRASWALSAGLQLAPERLPVVGISRRLVGPVWLEGWVRPRLELALPAAGASLRVEF